MSVLPKKNILVVSDSIGASHPIEAALKEAGAVLHYAACATLSTDKDIPVDLVLVNHLHREQICTKALTALRTSRVASPIPIVALVEDQPSEIERVLALGAADYFTPTESLPHVISKIRVALGESLRTADTALLDITEVPHEPKRKNIKVLIVEDDPLLINLLTMRMDRAGFLYQVNRTGLVVSEDIDTFKPDVIVLDLTLPEVSGLDVLKELRANSAVQLPPVIVFSNRDSDEDRQSAQALGAARFHIKVMTDLSKLMNEIEDLVSFSARA